MINKGLFTSLRKDWKTPIDFFSGLNKEFNFNFDPCPPNPNFNGLEIEWKERNFVNPPYGREIGLWIKKGFEEAQKGKLVVFLIPSRTDTTYWHDYIMKADEIRFIKGRLCFDDSGKPAPFPSAVAIFLSRRKNVGVCGVCGGSGIDNRTYPSTECLCLKEDVI